jgi:hypothetical protein
MTRAQIEPCGPDTTIASSTGTVQHGEAKPGDAPEAQNNSNSTAPIATPTASLAAATKTP